MAGYGNRVQFDIYQPGMKQDGLPISFEKWENRAKEILSDGPFHYIADGAGSGATMQENRAAFERLHIIPRMLRDVDERDISVSIFGETFPAPMLLAPIGVQSIAHPDGEIASAQAAAESGVPFIASTASSHTLEEIASVLGGAPRWFQLYWGRDPEVTASMLQRAEVAGYSAIVATLDTQMLSWREKDLENAYLPFLQAEGIANYLADPAFRAGLDKPPEEDMMSAVMHFVQNFTNATLTWDDLSYLRKHTNLPIVLKGILHPEDAKKALDHGVDGIIVSNHGGRQVDGAVAAIDMLPEIADVIQGEIPLLVDSGIRRGADIVKALAMGASSVLIGRPYMYGLAAEGQVGVGRVIRNLWADFDLTMALAGKKNLHEIDRQTLRHNISYKNG